MKTINKKIFWILTTVVILSSALITLFILKFGSKIINHTDKTSNSLMEEGFIPPVGSKEIPLVVAFDNNYVVPALVSLSSLLSNANKNTYYKINFIVTDEFQSSSKSKILKLGETYKNFGVKFFNISQEAEIFKSWSIFYERFSKEMFYRFKIPNLLKDEKKCIYMDVDTIVLKDLSELYDQNVDDYYIGGIFDGTRVAVLNNDTERRLYYERLGVDDMDDYINSGVILFNLDECRKENVEDKLLTFSKEMYEKEGIIQDQDVFNAVCHGRIKNLPLEFNTQTYLDLKNGYEKLSRFFKRYIGKSEWEKAISDPTIIHYALDKPWRNFDINFASKWWKIADQAPEYVKDEVKPYIFNQGLKEK